MTKLIEKVAIDIRKKGVEEGINVGLITSVRMAKAAISTLDIIILPKGAEPEVGDIVELYVNKNSETPYLLQYYSKNLQSIIIEQQKVKIINRNGKCVLMEEE